MYAVYVSSSSFYVNGNKASEFNTGRRVKLDCGLDGIKYATVVSSSYSAPNTTVTIDESTLTANLVSVLYGIIQPGIIGSLPDHTHDGTEGTGGILPVYTNTEEPTGFINYKVGSEISFSGDEVTISGTYSYYIKGLKYDKDGADNVTIDNNSEGDQYIYFDGDTLTYSTDFFNDLLSDYAYVATLYWDDTNNQIIYFGDERHGITMDAATHYNLHIAEGTRYVSGLALVDLTVDGDGSTDDQAQFGTSSGYILDEDLMHSINTITVGSTIPVFYKNGAAGNWRTASQAGFAFLNGASYPKYNLYSGGVWTQPQIGTNQYVIYHIFATNDINNQIVSIMGQDKYTSNTAAREAAPDELNNMVLEGLPFVEFIALGSIILNSESGYTNSVKTRIISVSAGVEYIDWRHSRINSVGGGISDHGNLSGLADNDHPQYITWDFGSQTISGTGNIYCNGVVLTAPNNSEWLLQVTNSGTLYTVEV